MFYAQAIGLAVKSPVKQMVWDNQDTLLIHAHHKYQAIFLNLNH